MDRTTSFMRSLCVGQIEEDLLLPFPRLAEDQRETLRSVVASLAQLLGPREADFREWDQRGELPAHFIEELKAFGLFSFIIPEEHGGMGFGSAAYSRALQEVARYDASVAVTVGAHSSIGMRGLLLFGTEDQKRRYLPRLATGGLIAAFCLTEPESGSDAASIRTSAVREGDAWVLNGSKLWITNGGIADFFTVFAKTGDRSTRGHMTAFLVTRDMPGVSNGPHEDKMGLRASSTTTVELDNVRVPDANVLGEVGKGFKVAMKILNSGRTGLGGGSVGAMKHLLALTTRHAKERRQFDRPIAEFGLVQQKIGHMVVECYAAEAVVNMVASLADRGYEEYAVEAAISKVFASEALWRCADEALQTAAGIGYMRELPYERILRDCRINRIFEGTNDILRLFIALSALDDVGSQLRDVADSLRGVFADPIKGFGVLSEYARRRASLATGFIPQPKGSFTRLEGKLRPQAEAFEGLARELAGAMDRRLRRYGRKVIQQQMPTRRLADVMIDLFVLACTLSRVDTALKEKGEAASAEELSILQVLAGQVQRRARANLDRVDTHDDELVSSLARQAVEREGYGWDVL